MSKKYFSYLFNKDKNINIVISVILFILMPLMMFITVDNSYDNFAKASGYYLFFVIILLILTYVLPVFNFKYLHSKRAVDTYMQLPLTKQEVFRTKFQYTNAQVFIPWFINFLLANLVFVIKGQSASISLAYMIFMFIVGGILTFSLISFNTYIYQKCNNLVDGIIVIIMYHILLASFVGGIYAFIGTHSFSNVLNTDMLTFLILDYDFVSSLVIKGVFDCTAVTSIISSKEFLFTLFVGITTFILSIHDVKHRDSERAESNTDSYLCYPTIITSFVLIILLQFDRSYDEYSIMVIITFVLYMIGIFIYKRMVKIKIKYVLVYVALILLANLFTFAFYKTDGFNLDKNLPTSYQSYNVSIYNNTDTEYSFSSLDGKEQLYLLVNEIYAENRLEYYDSHATIDFKDNTYSYDGQYIDILYYDGDFDNYSSKREYIFIYCSDNQIKELFKMAGK
jgi:hypothetical protein